MFQIHLNNHLILKRFRIQITAKYIFSFSSIHLNNFSINLYPISVIENEKHKTIFKIHSLKSKASIIIQFKSAQKKHTVKH